MVIKKILFKIKALIYSKSWKTAVFFIYAALLIIMALKHEPWFDEGQAWLLARDTSIKELIWEYLRYEGSTGLWHILLMIPSKLGLPYHSINIISIVFAIAGVYVFIRYSPFPSIIKTVFPFTYFIFYQYAVVARSYVIMPLILFLIAGMYKRRYEKPGLFILLILILANINLHGLLISISIMGVNFLELIPKWKTITSRNRAMNVVSYILFALMFLSYIAILWPPGDLEVGGDFLIDIKGLFDIRVWPLQDFAIGSGFKAAWGSIYYIAKTTLFDSLTTNALHQITGYSVLHLVLTSVIALFTIIITLFWFKARRNLLLYMALLAPLILLFSVKYVNVWHEGILFLIWIFALWISFDESGDKIKNNSITYYFKILMCAAIMFVFAVQVYWSYNVYKYDFYNNYSASRDVADYIKENRLEGKKICATSFHSVSILPYFRENILSNYNNGKKPSFWFWSLNNNTPRDSSELSSILRMKPDLIILSVKIDSYENCMLNIPGYSRLPFFDGNLAWKDVLFEKDAFVLYRKNSR